MNKGKGIGTEEIKRMSPVRDYTVMFYTYIIKSKKDGKFYTGSSSDLRKRLSQHANGMSSYTKGRGPFSLIYYEACLEEGDARSRELYLKSGMGKRYIQNRLRRFLSLTG